MSSDNGSTQKRSKRNRVIILAGCILLIIFGLAFLLGGAALLVYNMGTDKDGYTLSNVYEIRNMDYAFALWVAPLRVPLYLSWLSPEDITVTKWTIHVADSSQQVFAGWTKDSDGESYLNTIRFETPPIWHWYVAPYYAEIEIPEPVTHNQGAPTRPPNQEIFWLASDQSSNTITLNWDPAWDIDTGRRILIIMNADGSSDIEVNIQLGFKVPIFSWLPLLLIPLGLMLLLIGIFVIRKKKLVEFRLGTKKEKLQP